MVKKYLSLNKSRGFTLIELLVGIAIIGILAVALFSVLNPIEQIKKPRDSQRKHDFDQLRKALDIYFINNGSIYPPAPGGTAVPNEPAVDGKIEGKDWGTPWLPYMPKLPIDPLDSQPYVYRVANDQTWYRLFAKLERCQDPQVMPDPNFTNCADYYNYSVASPNLEVSLFTVPTPVPPTPTPTPTPTSLVGKWSFESLDVNNKTPDTSGNNYHGTVNGATWQDASTCGSGHGRCLQFDGDDYVSLPNVSELNPTGDFTIAAWVNITSYCTGGGCNGGVIYSTRYQSSSGGIDFAIGNTQGYLTLTAIGVGYVSHNQSPSSSIPLNTWIHVATTKNGDAKLYVNKVEVTSGIITSIFNGGTPHIGREISGGAGQGYFIGLIDEVRIYDRALTPAEIQNL